jgi:hypothetical protein
MQFKVTLHHISPRIWRRFTLDERAPGALGAHVEVDGRAAYAFGPMG